jgi:hypothetical protein
MHSARIMISSVLPVIGTVLKCIVSYWYRVNSCIVSYKNCYTNVLLVAVTSSQMPFADT